PTIPTKPVYGGPPERCGQLLYQGVGKPARTTGINRPVDIRPAYPQEQHRHPLPPTTICPLGFRSPDPSAALPWTGLSTEKPLFIKIYINYLLKLFLFVLSCILIRLPTCEYKLTYGCFFSRISDPLKGLSGSVVNYSGI